MTPEELQAIKAQVGEMDADAKRLIGLLPADDIDGATLEWYAAKFEQSLGHAHFGQRLRNYAAAVREILGRGEQQDFYDAVRDDPEMSAEAKAKWLAYEKGRDE